MAAHTSMLHVRIDEELKAQTAETLAKFGLTASIDKKRLCGDNPHCAGGRHERHETIRAV